MVIITNTQTNKGMIKMNEFEDLSTELEAPEVIKSTRLSNLRLPAQAKHQLVTRKPCSSRIL
ncbi:MAG: hypothetical protein ACXAB7_11085 [Candidatus Kariarchaeaceae archaeon]